MIYKPEAEHSTVGWLNEMAMTSMIALDRHQSPLTIWKERRESEIAAQNEWQKLLGVFSDEKMSRYIAKTGKAVENARKIALKAHIANKDDVFTQYEVKKTRRAFGEKVTFDQYESWLDFLYSELGLLNLNKKDSRQPTLVKLIGRLQQLDHGYLDLVDSEKRPVRFDFTIGINEAERNQAAQLHAMARQYVICQIASDLTARRDEPQTYGNPNKLWHRYNEISIADETDQKLKQLEGIEFSRKSYNEMRQIISALLHNERARLYELRSEKGTLSNIVSNDLYPLLPIYAKTRAEQFDNLHRNFNLSFHLQAMNHLAQTFISAEMIYIKLHPAAWLKTNSRRIIDLTHSLQQKHGDYIAQEELHPFNDFERDVSSLLG